MKWFIANTVSIVLFLSVHARADMTGREVMEKVDDRYTGEDQVAEMTMTLIKSTGRKRVRKVKVWQKHYGEDTRSLMRFIEPADVKGTGFLVWEHEDREDDQWLYMPAQKKVRRISGGEKEDSFMGTDFSYEDIGSHSIDDYSYTLLHEEEYDGVPCYVVRSVPKEGVKKSYSRTVSWVRKDNLVAVKIDFFDTKGELLKQLLVTSLEEIDGIWTERVMEMDNVQKKHKTILSFDQIQYNTGLADDLFTERNLREE
jgi:outer membrane lipoprotein-sorting protein